MNTKKSIITLVMVVALLITATGASLAHLQSGYLGDQNRFRTSTDFQSGDPTADFGDAPDDTNPTGANFEAYPGIPARFPTVFDITIDSGPRHANTPLGFYLGEGISGEENAESGVDTDLDGNNLIITGTVALASDNDGQDDGLSLPGDFDHCQTVTLEFSVTVTDSYIPELGEYANLWLDWDRDGEWGGRAGRCNSEGNALEWAVQNMPLDLPGPGNYTFTTPAFVAWNPAPSQPMWVRITVGEGMVEEDDGSGPIGGYAYGETEDYLWSPGPFDVYLPIVAGGVESPTQPPTDDDDTHIDVAIPTEVQAIWAQIPAGDQSVVLDGEDLALTITNDSGANQQVEILLTLFVNGEKYPIPSQQHISDSEFGIEELTIVHEYILDVAMNDGGVRSPALLVGEARVMDVDQAMSGAEGPFYTAEIGMIALHPHEDDLLGKIVAYNPEGLSRQMSAVQLDHNAVLSEDLFSRLPAEMSTENLANFIPYQDGDPVLFEPPQDPIDRIGPPTTGHAPENLPGDRTPDFTITLCPEWYTAPSDNGFGEDIGLSDTGWRARGARIRVYQFPNMWIFDGWLDKNGCAAINTQSAAPIIVQFLGEVRLESGGGYITVRQLTTDSDDIGDLVTSAIGIAPVVPDAVYRPEIWGFDSLSILSYAAQERFNGGVEGETFYLKIAGCDDVPGAGSCSKSSGMFGEPGIFISPGSQKRKFVVAHEFGHRILGFAANYKNDCAWGGDTHGMKSVEYGSCAAMEGWANYVAVDVWNFHPHEDAPTGNPHGILVYWDGKNTVYNAELGNDQAYCLQVWGLICDVLGVELDWMRQWWDYHTNPGDRPTHEEMFQLVDDTIWFNGFFAAAEAIEDALGNNADRWVQMACYNGVLASCD